METLLRVVDVKINAQSDPEGDHHCTGDWSTSATGAGSDGIKTLSSCPRTAPCSAAQDGEWISGTAGHNSHNYTACVSAPSVPQPVFTMTEKAPNRASSWLKVATTTFTFKTLIRHYAKRA